MTDLTASTRADSRSMTEEERLQRAWQSVRKFRQMQSSLSEFARMLTGNRNMRVVADNGIPRTDGNVIYMRPPIELGDVFLHNRVDCDRRGDDSRLKCQACRAIEEVFVIILHEIAHIAYGSFTHPSETHIAELLSRAVAEYGSKYSDRLSERIAAAPAWEKGSYLDLAAFISPFLKHIVNCLEDARINEATFKARPGVRVMTKAHVTGLMADGIDSADGVTRWDTAPLNAQVICGLFIIASGYEPNSWFHPDVELALGDTKLRDICERSTRSLMVSDVYANSFDALARLRELGFCRTEEEEDEEDGPSDEGDTGSPDSDSDSGSDDDRSTDSEENREEDSGDGEESGGLGGEEEESDLPAEDQSDETGDGSGSDDDQGQEGEGSQEEDSPESDQAGNGESSEQSDEDNEGDLEDSSEAEGELDDDGADGSGEPADDGSDDDGSDQQDEGYGDGDIDEDSQSGDDGNGTSERSDDTSEEVQDGTGSDASSEDDGPDRASDDSGVHEGKPDGVDDEGLSDQDEVPSESGAAPDDSEADAQPDSADSSESTEAAETSDQSSGDDPQEFDGAGNRGTGEIGNTPSYGTSEGQGFGGEAPDLSGEDDSADDAGGERNLLPERTDDESEKGTDPIDTGADSGKGGTRVIGESVPAPPFGDDEDVERHLQLIENHDDERPESVHANKHPDDEEAVDLAIVQSTYFESPSTEIGGVDIFHYNHDAITPEMQEDEAYTWNRKHLRRWDISDEESGAICDMDIPESVLSRSLLRMNRIFKDNERAKYDKDQKRGHVDKRMLGRRAWSGDRRLFGKLTQPGRKSHAVCIGIDVSGSTLGENLVLAKRAAKAQAELCARTGVKFSVFAHSTGYSKDWDTEEEQYRLSIFVVKDWNDPWDDKSQRAIDELASVAGNLDGHSIEFYRKQLDQVSAHNKYLMYYSDGKMPAMNHDEELEIMQREIRHCRQVGYVLMAVGIRTDSPVRHGLDTCRVDSDEDIPAVVRHLERRVAVLR